MFKPKIINKFARPIVSHHRNQHVLTKAQSPTGAYMRAIGAPFNITSSSCHIKIPKTFRWTATPGSYPTVVMDSQIYAKSNLNGRPDKYAWICESMGLQYVVDVDRLKNDKAIHASYKKIFLSDKSLLMQIPHSEFCYAGSNLPWVPVLSMPPKKTKLVSMMASAKNETIGHKHRLAIAAKYKSQLDLFGGAHGSPRIGAMNATSQGHLDKTDGIVPYMFSVVVENAQYGDYFTEKITDCFASFTIPIYWGCPTISEYFDRDGIIILDDDFRIEDLSEGLYKSKLPSVIENNKRVKALMMADDYLYEKIIYG